MPRVLPILSRLLRRRKNIHWSPLLHRDTTFPVPRRATNSTVFNPKCATGLLLIVSPSITSPLVPHHSHATPHPFHPRPKAVGVVPVGGDRGATRGGRGSGFFVLFRHVSPPSLSVAPPRLVGSPHWPWAWPGSTHSRLGKLSYSYWAVSVKKSTIRRTKMKETRWEMERFYSGKNCITPTCPLYGSKHARNTWVDRCAEEKHR